MSEFPQTQQLIKQAKKWVAQQERSKFGIFAVPEDRLVLFAAWRFSQKLGANYVENNLIDRYLSLVESFRSIESAAVEAEYLFWQNEGGTTYHSGGSFANNNNYLENPSEVGEFTGRLWNIYHRPHRMRYFEANVWDGDFIERCIADGIDPMVARSLLA